MSLTIIYSIIVNMIDYNLLAIQNPWWQSTSAIEQDPKIKEFKDAAIKYRPSEILDLKFVNGAINIVLGPRQTGKSTTIKLLVRHLLRDSFPAEQIFYFNCDAIESRQELIKLALRYLDSIKTVNTLPENYILLDEISSVTDWPFAIKWLADAGQLARSKILLTGSSSINLKKSGEYLPGRRGKGKDIMFLPVKFDEFFALTKPEFKLPSTIKSFLQIKKLHTELIKKGIKIEQVYANFLLTGGFLKMIDLFVKREPFTEAVELYNSTLKSEMAKFGKKEVNSRMILRKLISSLTAETSYTNIAEEAELGSKNTAIDYLNFFSDSFLLNEVLFHSIPQRRLRIKKNKKFYPTDPFILWIFKSFVTGSSQIEAMRKEYNRPPLDSYLAELFVGSELYKRNCEFYYYKNSRELDFYLPKLNLGIEVKYKNKITASDLKPLEQAKKKILVSKDTLERRNETLIIPASLFGFIPLPFSL